MYVCGKLCRVEVLSLSPPGRREVAQVSPCRVYAWQKGGGEVHTVVVDLVIVLLDVLERGRHHGGRDTGGDIGRIVLLTMGRRRGAGDVAEDRVRRDGRLPRFAASTRHVAIRLLRVVVKLVEVTRGQRRHPRARHSTATRTEIVVVD